MARGTYLGEDITIFLSEEEVIQIGLLELDWNASSGKRLFHKPLDVVLETQEGSHITCKVQNEYFDDLGDGIKVERTDYGFLVKVNYEALWRIENNPLFGTRYDGSNKIHFYTEKSKE